MKNRQQLIRNGRLLRRNLPGILSLAWLGVAAWHAHRGSPFRALAGLVTLLTSTTSIVLYAYDKIAAQRGTWRIAEATLHGVSLLGGWPGATLAQSMFRHKCRKAEFLQLHIVTVVGYFVLLMIVLR